MTSIGRGNSLWIDEGTCPWCALRSAAQMAEKNAPLKQTLFGELWAFMKVRKKWWLLPVITILLIVGGLLVLAQGSAVAPFIYTVF